MEHVHGFLWDALKFVYYPGYIHLTYVPTMHGAPWVYRSVQPMKPNPEINVLVFPDRSIWMSKLILGHVKQLLILCISRPCPCFCLSVQGFDKWSRGVRAAEKQSCTSRSLPLGALYRKPYHQGKVEMILGGGSKNSEDFYTSTTNSN